jgi:hypothetical protein
MIANKRVALRAGKNGAVPYLEAAKYGFRGAKVIYDCMHAMLHREEAHQLGAAHSGGQGRR